MRANHGPSRYIIGSWPQDRHAEFDVSYGEEER